MVQSEQHVIYWLMAGGGGGGGGGWEAQANMKETDGERLPWVEAHDSWPSRKEPLMWMMPLHLHVNQKFDYDMIV